eukprot:CAMPEP_0115323954 /NCGR_PEP_ID=MMETSP0270-20121206/82218_1 /TAXON_ID=71861 /ORGANISM="Scrippsiella trochoidea, Strain CCMP3099" /LENGTH=150 /DNA_ID=CAMNT_0002744035 /DNA_START=67 /DNA_END=516 /DNA_ORIENTATION=+
MLRGALPHGEDLLGTGHVVASDAEQVQITHLWEGVLVEALDKPGAEAMASCFSSSFCLCCLASPVSCLLESGSSAGGGSDTNVSLSGRRAMTPRSGYRTPTRSRLYNDAGAHGEAQREEGRRPGLLLLATHEGLEPLGSKDALRHRQSVV